MAATFYVQDGSAYALGSAHMLAGFGNCDAVVRRSIARGADSAHGKSSSKKESRSKKAHSGWARKSASSVFIVGVEKRAYAQQDEYIRGRLPEKGTLEASAI